MMGARGKAPTPTAILKLRGSWRAKRREKDGEPMPETGRPIDPPGQSEAETALWQHLLDQLEAVPGLLTVIDGFQLERYCKTLIRWRQVEAELKRFEGLIAASLRDDAARQVIRSLWTESRACDMQLKQTEDKFGLTPSARTRIRMFGNFADAAKSSTGNKKERFFA